MRAYAKCSQCYRQMSVDLDELACSCGGTFRVLHPNTIHEAVHPLASGILRYYGSEAQPRIIEKYKPEWSDEQVHKEVDDCVEKLYVRLRAEDIMDEIDGRRQ